MVRRAAAFRADSAETAALPPCESPGCSAAGEFRAPKDRSKLTEYYRFCLAHVRAYNASWDYYKGMQADEIEQNLRADSGWQRPTWPLGRLGNSRRMEEAFADPFGVLRGDFDSTPRHRAPPKDEAPPELKAALNLMELSWPLDQAELRARYMELAKRYHPDANGGDRAAEDKLKDINRAYSLLRARLQRSPPQPAATASAAAS